MKHLGLSHPRLNLRSSTADVILFAAVCKFTLRTARERVAYITSIPVAHA
ncbi:MAG: hypothetical protein ABIS34_01300 [Opitutus sp.]